VEQGADLTELPGIGEDLAGQIREYVEQGGIRELEQLRRQVPPTLTNLLEVSGLGPKRVAALYRDLGVRTPTHLRQALQAGQVRELSGFGAKLEERILEALENRPEGERRTLWAEARDYAEPLLAYIREHGAVQRAVIAGSYRRRKETVGDLDILAVADDGAAVAEHFTAYDEVDEVASQGSTRSTVYLRSGLQVDLRVVPTESFGAALHYFTGSKAHNIAVRRLGQERGYKVNEYGVYEGEALVAGETEPAVYAAVDLPYIEPELREDRGEIEAAGEGRLPDLVARADLRGDLHCHTTATDGHNSLREMAEAARKAGLDYLAVTDHSQSLRMVKGLDAGGLVKQAEAIDALNAELEGITLLKGLETEILADGSLDLTEEELGQLDVVIGAMHGHFDLGRDKQTERLLRALEHPYLTFLAHPTGRRMPDRGPMELDMDRLIDQVAQRGCYLELNGAPDRLDLSDRHCRQAKEAGAGVVINSDAHSTTAFGHLDHGVGQARRGWLEAGDVLNTRALGEMRRALAATRLK
jgi:DNA polymerase (family 10)